MDVEDWKKTSTTGMAEEKAKGSEGRRRLRGRSRTWRQHGSASITLLGLFNTTALAIASTEGEAGGERRAISLQQRPSRACLSSEQPLILHHLLSSCVAGLRWWSRSVSPPSHM